MSRTTKDLIDIIKSQRKKEDKSGRILEFISI